MMNSSAAFAGSTCFALLISEIPFRLDRHSVPERRVRISDPVRRVARYLADASSTTCRAILRIRRRGEDDRELSPVPSGRRRLGNTEPAYGATTVVNRYRVVKFRPGEGVDFHNIVEKFD